MIFNSFSFLLGFLPLALAIYILAARYEPIRLPVLFILSVAFYGWWNPPFILLLLGSILVNWIAANLFVRTEYRFMPTAAIVLNLAVLAFFKYLGFFTQVARDATGFSIEPISVVLPLGISFFTFHHIMYLADLRAGKTTAFPLVHYALYIGFFPQVLSGPLVRYHEVMGQWTRPPFGAESAERIGRGIVFIVLGLAEKVLLGDPLADVVNPIYLRAAEISAGAAVRASLGLIEAWTAAIGFGLQIYFDFAGYSHIAVGLALVFGIVLPQNFNAPYRATSLSDFWRRWHMTLSRFLRDYVYVPLGGNRHGLVVQACALMITMALAGLWHGAGWAFVLWGSLHGAVLVGGVLWRRLLPPMPAAIGWLLTLLFVMTTWPLFRAQSIAAAIPILEALTRIGEAGPVPDLRPLWPAAAVALLAPTTWTLATRGRPHPILALVLATLVVVVLTHIGEDTTYEFVYFQF
jgi:alginate O-acetyltransferase complex protein AlgI